MGLYRHQQGLDIKTGLRDYVLNQELLWLLSGILNPLVQTINFYLHINYDIFQTKALLVLLPEEHTHTCFELFLHTCEKSDMKMYVILTTKWSSKNYAMSKALKPGCK